MRLCICVVAAALLGGACADEVILDNEGIACLSTTGEWPTGGQVFEADSTVTVVVRFDDCLSSSCDTNREASCEVEVTGDRIVVTSRARYTDERSAGGSCTTDCGIFETTCETPALAEGDYSFAYGGDELPFAVPSTTGSYCVSTSP